MLLPGVGFLALVVVHNVHFLRRGWEGTSPLDESLRLFEGVALLAVASGVCWQWLASRRMRGRLARLVVELGSAVRAGGLRDLLAAALDDPTLDLLYPFDGGWIDSSGERRSPPADDDRGLTSLVQEGEVAAVVVHRKGLLDDARLVEELGRAARLAIDHERLQAQQRAQLERLRAARAAIVTAADAERRRLERDLHDGAQQGLAGLAMAIGLGRSTAAPDAAASLALAQTRVREALDGVRAIAQAAYPAALDEAGLAAGLDVLSEWRPDVEIRGVPARRFDPALEAGAYFILDALTRPIDGGARVNVRVDGGRLILAVVTGSTGGLAEVEDRVGALGGRLHVASTASGETSVRVELACA